MNHYYYESTKQLENTFKILLGDNPALELATHKVLSLYSEEPSRNLHQNLFREY